MLQTDFALLIPLLSAVFLVYVPTLNDYFHGDDFLAFIDLTTKSPWQQISDTFMFDDSNVYWRPLGQVYYLALYELAGLDAFVFHLANIVVFLITLAAAYAFCLRFGLGRIVAVGTVLLFGLMPAHVVSVSWTTNGPRLLAMLFVLLSLICLQEALRRRALRFELLTFVCMALAILSDEVATALTPLPVVYALVVMTRERGWWWAPLARAFVYGGLGMVATLLQLFVGVKENPAPTMLSLSKVSLGPHVLRDFWALISKLALPLTDGTSIASITDAQWAAGAVATAALTMLLIAGSWRVRFLVVWCVLALAPFTLWTTPIAPARYVYIAALPWSMLVAWGAASMWQTLRATGAWAFVTKWGLTAGVTAVAACLLAITMVTAGRATIDRNERFAQTAEPYRALANDLQQVLPHVASNSRLVIYYGVWEGSFVWQDAVVQTIYRDPTLTTINVDWAQAENYGVAPRPNDVVVYYTERGFIVPAPRR